MANSAYRKPPRKDATKMPHLLSAIGHNEKQEITDKKDVG